MWSHLVAKCGSLFQALLEESAETRYENRTSVHNFVKENKCWCCVLGRKLWKECFMRSPVSHTNAHAIHGRPTPKDEERFRNESVYEFHSLKALKTLKEVSTSDVEKIKNERELHIGICLLGNKGNMLHTLARKTKVSSYKRWREK